MSDTLLPVPKEWQSRAFITLKAGENPTNALNEELKKFVSEHRSAIARPDVIQFAPSPPKTRSGKVMRRILRKIAEGDTPPILATRPHSPIRPW
jgi:acyl-coenzyme A synthetase/AMP-(fatty) acid ligase